MPINFLWQAFELPIVGAISIMTMLLAATIVFVLGVNIGIGEMVGAGAASPFVDFIVLALGMNMLLPMLGFGF